MIRQQQQQPQSRQFDTGRPMGMAKDDYLMVWNNAYYLIFDIIRNNRNQPNNIDLIHAVMFAISLIAHDDIRRKQEILFAEAMDFIEKATSASVEEKMEARVQVCAVTMGNLTSYVDQFRGLAHTLKIGELYNFEKPYAKRQHAFGNPDIAEPIQL